MTESQLLQHLRRARFRWLALALLRAVLGAAFVASLVNGVAEVGRLAGYPLLGDSFGSVRMAAQITTVAFVIVSIAQLTRLPSLQKIAAVADERFRLYDRLSTLLELIRQPTASLTLVERAAIEDAVHHAAVLRPSTIIPFAWPRWGWVVPIAASVSIALALLDLPSANMESAITPPGQELPDVRYGVTNESVRRVADALSRDPQTLDDPYLAAVARELEAFAAGLVGDEMVEGDRATDLDRLLEHLALATAKREDSVGETLHALATARLRSPGMPMPSRTGPDGTQETELGTLAEVSDAAPQGTNTLNEEPSLNKLLEDLASAIVASESQAAVRQPGNSAVDCDAETLLYAGICVSQSELRNTPSGLVQQGDAAGNPVGGAEQSNDRAGDAAGDGGQSDTTQGTEPAWREVEGESESVMLPDAASPAEGPRYEVPGLPSGEDRSAVEIHDVGQLASYRVEEGAMSQQSSGREYDEVVRLYFLPVQSDRAPSPVGRER